MIEFLKSYWSTFETAGAVAEQAAVASEECPKEDCGKTPVFAGTDDAEPWDAETDAGPVETSVAAVAGATEAAVYGIDGAKDAMARSPARQMATDIEAVGFGSGDGNIDEEKLTKGYDKTPAAATFGGVQIWDVVNGDGHKRVAVRAAGDGIVDGNIGVWCLRDDCQKAAVLAARGDADAAGGGNGAG